MGTGTLETFTQIPDSIRFLKEEEFPHIKYSPQLLLSSKGQIKNQSCFFIICHFKISKLGGCFERPTNLALANFEVHKHVCTKAETPENRILSHQWGWGSMINYQRWCFREARYHPSFRSEFSFISEVNSPLFQRNLYRLVNYDLPRLILLLSQLLPWIWTNGNSVCPIFLGPTCRSSRIRSAEII